MADIANETKPKQAGWFSPTPLAAVTTEDPALNGGPNKVTMWSYPVVDDGLIYVVDLRNGLYILEYRGKFTGEIKKLDYELKVRHALTGLQDRLFVRRSVAGSLHRTLVAFARERRGDMEVEDVLSR